MDFLEKIAEEYEIVEADKTDVARNRVKRSMKKRRLTRTLKQEPKPPSIKELNKVAKEYVPRISLDDEEEPIEPKAKKGISLDDTKELPKHAKRTLSLDEEPIEPTSKKPISLDDDYDMFNPKDIQLFLDTYLGKKSRPKKGITLEEEPFAPQVNKDVPTKNEEPIEPPKAKKTIPIKVEPPKDEPAKMRLSLEDKIDLSLNKINDHIDNLSESYDSILKEKHDLTPQEIAKEIKDFKNSRAELAYNLDKIQFKSGISDIQKQRIEKLWKSLDTLTEKTKGLSKESPEKKDTPKSTEFKPTQQEEEPIEAPVKKDDAEDKKEDAEDTKEEESSDKQEDHDDLSLEEGELRQKKGILLNIKDPHLLILNPAVKATEFKNALENTTINNFLNRSFSFLEAGADPVVGTLVYFVSGSIVAKLTSELTSTGAEFSLTPFPNKLFKKVSPFDGMVVNTKTVGNLNITFLRRELNEEWYRYRKGEETGAEQPAFQMWNVNSLNYARFLSPHQRKVEMYLGGDPHGAGNTDYVYFLATQTEANNCRKFLANLKLPPTFYTGLTVTPDIDMEFKSADPKTFTPPNAVILKAHGKFNVRAIVDKETEATQLEMLEAFAVEVLKNKTKGAHRYVTLKNLIGNQFVHFNRDMTYCIVWGSPTYHARETERDILEMLPFVEKAFLKFM